MMPHCKRDSQFELFEGELPRADATPRLELPIQRSQEIDLARAMNIYGCDRETVRRMLLAGILRGAYQIPGSTRWRIPYNSVVEHCDLLRLHYRISDTAIKRPHRGRLKDRDLLPFPLDETITFADAINVLDCSQRAIFHMLDEGVLVGYQLLPNTNRSRWRIWRPSLERALDNLRRKIAASASSRHSASTTV